MRGEHDQEINGRILDDIIQNCGDPGLSYGPGPMTHPNDDQEHQEVCKWSFIFNHERMVGQKPRFKTVGRDSITVNERKRHNHYF